MQYTGIWVHGLPGDARIWLGEWRGDVGARIAILGRVGRVGVPVWGYR